MEKLIKSIPITTGIILYLYICGAIYLLSFWQVFEVDISNIATVWDIPKGFVYPFFIAFGSSLVGTFSGMLTNSQITKIPKVESQITKISPLKAFAVTNKIVTIFFLTGAALLIIVQFIPTIIHLWIFGTLLLAFAFIFEIIKMQLPLFDDIKSPTVIAGILYLSIITPFMAFGVGKYSAKEIYYNMNITYVNVESKQNSNVIITSPISLKLLGFLGDKVIVSSLDNKQIFVLNQSALNVIELKRKRE